MPIFGLSTIPLVVLGCSIPRFWVGGADLIKHRQEYHSMGPDDWPTDGSFPSEYLSFKAVPEDFNPLELLEHNKLFFGTREASDAWCEEVKGSKDKIDGTHEMVYKRPDVGIESKRKLRACEVVYGTIRASRSVKAVTNVAAVEFAGEMIELILNMTIFNISLSEEFTKKLVWCDIGGELGEVTAYAAHLVGLNEMVHREKVKSRDAEIKRLMNIISDKERSHKKEMEKVTSVCDKRLKEIGDLAHAQGARYGQTLVDGQDHLIEQFILATSNAIRVSTEQRWENISSLKKLTSETCSQLVTNDSMIEID